MKVQEYMAKARKGPANASNTGMRRVLRLAEKDSDPYRWS
jgi:hypothetical protein